MSTAEERKKILTMIAEGKITAQEGAQLLKALGASGEKRGTPQELSGEPRFLRLRITNMESGKVKANINLPMTLVSVGLRMGARFAPDLDGVDFDEVMEAINSGMRGKILDVEDDEGSERVEIFVE